MMTQSYSCIAGYFCGD